MKKRIDWIDIAKGIGMMLVIAGHTISLRYSTPIYAFHMPLFFFLSGLVFKDRKDHFLLFLKKIFKSLLKPWMVMLLISFFVCILIPQWREEITMRAVLTDLYTSNTNIFQNSSLWYLVCYFFMLLVWFFSHKLFEGRYGNYNLVAYALVLLFLPEVMKMAGIPLGRLPFKIDTAMVALVFFVIAFRYKGKVMAFVEGFHSRALLLVLCVIAAALCVLNGWSNINSLDFGRIRLCYYPIALLSIAAVLAVSKQIALSDMTWLKSSLIFYGRNSLIVFGFQSLFIRLYLLFFNNVQSLSMQLYADNPMTHQIGSFLVVTFIASPLVVYSVLALRKRNINIL